VLGPFCLFLHLDYTDSPTSGKVNTVHKEKIRVEGLDEDILEQNGGNKWGPVQLKPFNYWHGTSYQPAEKYI